MAGIHISVIRCCPAVDSAKVGGAGFVVRCASRSTRWCSPISSEIKNPNILNNLVVVAPSSPDFYRFRSPYTIRWSGLVEEGKRKKMRQVSRDGVAGGERNRRKMPPVTVVRRERERSGPK